MILASCLQVWFHTAAWGIPGALTVMLLALNKVEGDNISGVCFVGLYDLDALRYFVLAPLCIGVAVGLFLILAGIVSLNNVRQVIQHDERNQEKLKKFMIRIGVFSCLYLVPLVTLLACYTYEQSYRSAWEKTWVYDRCQEYSIPCPHQVRMKHYLVFYPTVWANHRTFKTHTLCKSILRRADTSGARFLQAGPTVISNLTHSSTTASTVTTCLSPQPAVIK